MIKASTKINMNAAAIARKLERKARWASASPLTKSVSAIARSAKASIKKSKKKYSPPGQPPHTRGGLRSLKKAIMYHVDKNAGMAIVGPSGLITALTGHYHEFGGVQYKKSVRKQYRIGSIGPLPKRSWYKTNAEAIKNGSETPKITKDDVVFAKLKTHRMLSRAWQVDKDVWPNAGKKMIRRIYSKRSFMWPAVLKNRRSIPKFFEDSIK
ncbi:MAG: hypothetical protein WCY59_07355 [Anaerovoracaceae bacterium]